MSNLEMCASFRAIGLPSYSRILDGQRTICFGARDILLPRIGVPKHPTNPLTISRHIVELHGGRIFAVSEGPGKGSSFTIELPVADGHPANVPEQASIPQCREQVARGLDHLTIVAVDDNADARAFIDQVLRLHGATAISVDTGMKAIEAVSQHHPDVVLCDLMMPEMDGYAVLRGIRALNDERAKNVPVVALTAFAGAENRLKTKEAGFQFHLDKPIDPPQLIETIRALIKPSAR